MEQYIIDYLINFGQNLSPEVLSLIFLIFLYATILFLWHNFGKDGLFLYNNLAIILANIQVLKQSKFLFCPEPVALGTILFASTFVVNDILTEHEGLSTARQSIKLSVLSQIITTIIMIFTLCYSSEGSDAEKIQTSLYTLFAPSLRILIASLTAYYLSQLIDIKIYQLLKDYTNNKFMWMRLNLSTLISGLMDNIIFSTLAWVVLSPNPVSFKTLIYTYILSTYLARAIVTISSTPLIYLTYKLK